MMKALRPVPDKRIKSVKLIINPEHQQDFPTGCAQLEGKCFSLDFSNDQVQSGHIHISSHTKLMLAGNEELDETYNITSLDEQIDALDQVTLKFYKVTQEGPGKEKKQFVISDVEEHIRQVLKGSLLNRFQTFTFEYYEDVFDVTVELPESIDFGMFDEKVTQVKLERSMHQYSFHFIEEELKTDFSSMPTDFKEKLNQMRVGGLSSQIDQIYRRAFAGRCYGPMMVEKLGINHAKGILLYGPPGTGKTLLAREMSKVLNVVPKIINGPEITDKFVGQGERKLRQVWEDSISDYKKYGNQSPLHVIIFDQFDAIAKKRGSGESGDGDRLVNQLLTLIDGVESPKNFLVIGLTNRKDLIDEALLRPGRLEIHVEMFLPSEEGRKQIFEIHLKKIKDERLLSNQVSIDELAKGTKNFTGSEIEGLIRSAVTYSYEDLRNKKKISNDHFKKGRGDIVPKFGQDEKQIEKFAPQKYHSYGQRWERIQTDLNSFVERTRKLKSRKQTILISGPNQSGKTALASLYAKKLDFPFIKFVTCDNLYKMTLSQKQAYLITTFEDAKRCTQSCIILDDLLRIIQYVPFDTKYDPKLLQLLKNLLKLHLDKGLNQVIIATCSDEDALSKLDLLSLFTHQVQLKDLSRSEAEHLLGSLSANRRRSLGERVRYSVRSMLEMQEDEEWETTEG